MTYKLKWDILLSEERERKSRARPMPHRNGFDMDYDRIIYSSSLRRLQDKAQVFPLQENDFIRTRLTHSMEASALGRSMGLNISYWLLEKEIFSDKDEARKLSSLLAAACLVHDIGNPPFGHYGEDIIRNWFKKWFEKSEKYNSLNKEYKREYNKDIIHENQKKDFINFEGNAQGLRILSKLQFLNDQYGANFTYGTLATLIKYPWSSEKNNGKFGYFQSEKGLYRRIQDHTGLGDCKHPATYLLEAADDIAYLAADLEDGVKKGTVPWEKVYNDIKKKLENKYERIFKKLDKLRDQAEDNDIPDKELVNVQNFKVKMQGEMFSAVTKTFKENYSTIMNCEFEGGLLDNSTAKDIKDILVDVDVEYCYHNEEVLMLEIVGNSVLDGLLDFFVEAVVTDDGKFKHKVKTGKLFHLISTNFRYIQRLDNSGLPNREYNEMSLYDKLMLVTDYISGMTDSYAVNLHRKLTGVKLP